MTKEYIEREAAFDLISDFTGQAGTKTEYSAYWKSANALKTLPAADVAPVIRGEWIYDRSFYEADECYCSLCNQLMTTAKGIRMNYCPNCGARMDGGSSNG